MKDRKVILGSIMLLLTIVIVSLNLSFTDNNVDINEDHSSYNLSNILPIEIDSEFLDLPQEEKDSLITVVAILNTRVCPTCVTNTLEFFNEVKKEMNSLMIII
ncbi:hypothetical protein [Rhodohalobacter sp.]|uniref:hypothetical protein n=1 Tax=Rhodohalobacter sp. TaxID=1974210 RepID=UPI002ACE7D25|nr:hypothetical protein [Rhodohalobacter sp.]MDZ7756258.1 hypothetical protein [Rhodohalobacter sp.]